MDMKQKIEKELIDANSKILRYNDANTLEGIVEVTKAQAHYLGLCEIADAIRSIGEALKK